jgi:excisionase family DNA binding protein
VTYITIKQASDLLKVHPNTIRNWIKTGILKYYQVGRGYKVLVKTEDIDEILDKSSK